MQAQCLPAHKSREPRWMYRKVPKVTPLRVFSRIPVWCRKSQQRALVPTLVTLPEAEREAEGRCVATRIICARKSVSCVQSG